MTLSPRLWRVAGIAAAVLLLVGAMLWVKVDASLELSLEPHEA